MGITVFTTSIVYVMGFLARGTRDIVKKRIAKMHDHFIIIGSSMLAAQLEKGLREQGKPVIAICSDKKQAMYDKKPILLKVINQCKNITNGKYSPSELGGDVI
ncbi:hypothetical protein I3679_003055 [Proteus mirabilis]|uniref:Uncharacterized protein n=1 Tax=Proteus mirabilis TaxID=584 RepID=A0ABD5LUI1_PROMI